MTSNNTDRAITSNPDISNIVLNSNAANIGFILEFYIDGYGVYECKIFISF